MSEFNFLPLEERIVLDATAIIYVNAAAAAGGNGSSWAHAYNNLQDALTAAAAAPGPEQIWIAKGTYTPSQVYSPNGVVGGAMGSNNPNLFDLETFNLPNNVSLYGGFIAGETSLSQRNPVANQTILSGQLAGGSDVWHVVTAGNDISQTGVTASLNGLIIENGNATGPDLNSASGVIDYSHGSGGGLYANFGSNITLTNDVFINDTAATSVSAISIANLSSGGGAVASFDSTLNVSGSTFTNDSAGNTSSASSQGGAILAYEGSVNITNSSFSNDAATVHGGAVALIDSNGSVSNSVFSNNSTSGPATDFGGGGALYAINSDLVVSNSTFSGNTGTFSAGAVEIAYEGPSVFTTTFQNDLFIHNSAANEAGAITFTSQGDASPSDEVYVNNTTFSNNYSGGVGGAIDIDSLNVNFNNDIFSGNTAAGTGGALNSDDFFNNLLGTPLTTVSINNSTFLGNESLGSQAGDNGWTDLFSTPYYGGVVSPGGGALSSIWSSQLNVSNSTFLDNSALNANGGAVLTGGANMYLGSTANAIATGATTTLTNDTFAGNSASNGGALAVESSFPVGTATGSPTLILKNSLVTLNAASNDGGALYSYQGVDTLTGNILALNVAHSGSEIYANSSIINGDASSSSQAAKDLAQANIILGQNGDILS